MPAQHGDARLDHASSQFFFHVVDRVSFYRCEDTVCCSMQREQIVVPNQGHTLACMLRASLLKNDASFASCIVPHPQDEDLTIEIEHRRPRECLLMALRDARAEITSYIRTVDSHLIDTEMQTTDAASAEST